MLVNLYILPLVQIALYIWADIRYHSKYKWGILLGVITVGLVSANISWTYTITQQGEACGTVKYMFLSFAIIIPLFLHMVYVILKKAFF